MTDNTHDPIVIVSIARTPMGNFLGALKDLPATELGATAIKAAVERAGLTFDTIDEVIMGCVLPAGLGQAPARQAALGAGLSISTPCTTLNKVCGSAMKAMMIAHDELVAGSYHAIVAGGMESMSNAPYLLPKARQGYRLGHGQALDHMFLDGLEDAYDKGRLMGTFGEDCVKHYGFTRQQQDEFAIASLQRAQQATQDGSFAHEIAPIKITTRQGEIIIAQDELPDSEKIKKIPTLKPAFNKDGTITAANSSSISDGAAAVVMMRQSTASKANLKPLAKIIGHSTHAQEPHWFSTAPIGAIKKLLAKINWQLTDVDLFEINEAFAVVALAAMEELKLPHAKVNIHGGACALGHPLGASGARIVVTLIAALKTHNLKRGVASLCIGGGEATALAVEII
jgi:acetyl-CoA C-acetyltransferase